MKVLVRVGNDIERAANKYVVFETASGNYYLDVKNAFVFIQALDGDDSFKPFMKRCEAFKCVCELEDFFNKNNIKYSK